MPARQPKGSLKPHRHQMPAMPKTALQPQTKMARRLQALPIFHTQAA